MSAASGGRSDTDTSLDDGRLMDQEMATKAVEKAIEYGASYADIRLVSNQNTSISMRDGKVRNAIPGHDVGATLRCLVDGSWGVYSTSDV
ncbi:MAG: DNA gyrase modulator, partial [Candidatus Poseidoniaceae archaeon]|nr:DNA gyrase modulator [Candidatus Poseidoniaceae archaeon]